MRIEREGPGLILSWTGNGILQGADEVTGKWDDVSGATNAWPVLPTAERKFYRLRQ